MKKKRDIIGIIEEWYHDAPPLPSFFKLHLATFLPLIIFLSGLLLLGEKNVYLFGMLSVVAGLLCIVGSVYLYKRAFLGWKMTFYAGLLSLIPPFLALSIQGILQSFIIVGILFYLLFQIKSLYK